MASDSSEQSRQLTLKYLEASFRYDVDAVMAMLNPDVDWWTIGIPSEMPLSGRRDFAAVRKFLTSIARVFPEGMEYTVDGLIVEGPRVAVEVTAWGPMPDGTAYKNNYHFMIEYRDGKIARFHEYFDTHYAWLVQKRLGPTEGKD